MKRLEYSSSELIAIVLSRDLRDGEIGMLGAYSEIPQASIRLAQLTHAPNLSCIYGASGGYNKKGPLCHYVGEYGNLMGAEAVFPLDTILDLVSKRMDFFFAGGFQVDQYGNLNLVCAGSYGQPSLRGPGTAGLAISCSIFKRFYIYLQSHRKQSLVPKVDFVSGAGFVHGFNTRLEQGIPEGGPRLLMTPLGVFDFDPASKRMRLKSLNPGTALDQVIENTGFELMIPDRIPETLPPTEEELRILREEVDPLGFLR